MAELSLEQIAKLINEYRGLIKKRDPKQEQVRRLSRVDYLLRQVTLNGEQIMEMQTFDPVLPSNDDIRNSTVYGGLKEEYEKMERKYKGSERRYDNLVRKIEEELGSQFRLKNLIEEQRKEAERGYS